MKKMASFLGMKNGRPKSVSPPLPKGQFAAPIFFAKNDIISLYNSNFWEWILRQHSIILFENRASLVKMFQE